MAVWTGAFADRTRNEWLKLLCGQNTTGDLGSFTALTTFGLALFSTDPTNSDTAGSELTTAANTNYLRIPTSGKWYAPSGGSVSTSAECRWPSGTGTCGNNWSTVVGVGVMTNMTVGAGNLLAYMPLFIDYAPLSGSFMAIGAGALTLSLAGTIL